MEIVSELLATLGYTTSSASLLVIEKNLTKIRFKVILHYNLKSAEVLDKAEKL